MEDKTQRQYLSKLVVYFLNQSEVLKQLVSLQKSVTINPLSHYSKIIEEQLQYHSYDQLQEKIVGKLKIIDNISELGDQDFVDQVLKVLAGRLAGDVTLMLRITRCEDEPVEKSSPDEMLYSDQRGPIKCKLGIVDFDAKYLYQFEDWATERKKTVDIILQ